MLRKTTAALTLMVGLCGAARTHDSLVSLESAAMVAPEVDGVVERDAAWERASLIQDFVVLGAGRPAEAQTCVRVGHDAQALYVGFTCSLPPGQQPQATPRPRDGEVYRDESVEVFLAPDPQRPEKYFHFIVNAAGSMQDEIGRDAAWDAEWHAKTARIEGGWEAE
ncbi:MAG: hypothetical protein N2512_05415, partial [Armatimonadetes bacterium]|nr:hypothetical protein [Armatimonadota bacterium]